jgi:hypothetical protein
MNDYAQMIIARERTDGYIREAEQTRLARIARASLSKQESRNPHATNRFDPALRLRELRRTFLRRLLGEAATA